MQVTLDLTDTEVMMLHMQARCMYLFEPDLPTEADVFCKKLLTATSATPQHIKQEVGDLQRAIRSLQDKEVYKEFMRSYSNFQDAINEQLS